MGIARGAALIAGLTLLSRMLGLVRTLVFSQAIGANCLGAAYVTASQVPHLVYELVHTPGNEETPLSDLLRQDAEVSSRLGADEIQKLTDPAGYLGLAGAMVDRVLRAS